MSSKHMVIPRLLGKGAAKHFVFSETGITIAHATRYDTYIAWADFAALKFKVVPLYGLYFRTGCCYVIDLQTDDGQIHSIKLRSLYGIRRKQYAQLWMQLYNLFYHYHLRNMLGYYIQLKEAGQVFTISGVSVFNDGISWAEVPKLNWSEIEINSYTRYFVITKKGFVQHRRFLYFGDDWNACLLLDLLKQVLNAPNGDTSRHKAID